MKKSVKLWLEKAHDDLLWSKASLEDEIYYGVCFTAQQSAEKSLKAFLLSKDKIFRKTHDLSALLEECVNIDRSFEGLREIILPLIDYYVQTRYPDIGDFIDYNEEKAKDAIQRAAQIYNFIEEKLTEN